MSTRTEVETMLRKSKDTERSTKIAERPQTRALDARSPYDWFHEMDRWFDEFRQEFESRFWGPSWLTPFERGQVARQPLVDLLDEGREYVLRAELPGVKKEDLDIRVGPDGVELQAESQSEKEEREKDYYYRERSYRAFHRVVPLPDEVLSDQTEAKLKDGVLEIRLPKKEPTPKREPVRVQVE